MTQVDALSDVSPEEAGPTNLGWASMAALTLVFGIWGALGSVFLTPMMLFVPVAIPIALWVAWSDMAYMKIPNAAAMAIVLAYAVIGPFAFPLEEYLWRWTHLLVILPIGILLNAGRFVGAGDAKFAAAMAPLFALGDAGGVARLVAVTILAAFVTHRIVRKLPYFKDRFAHWESWSRRDFPMGLALGAVLAIYVSLVVYAGG